MKQTVFTTIACLAFCLIVKAQSHVDFGLKGGLNLTFFNVEVGGFGAKTQTETGYYGGVFTDFEVDDFLSIQPELLYIGLNDFKFLNAPLYVKYQVAEKIDLMVGPSLNYFFDFFSNKFKIRADICAAYNITSSFDVHTKYTLGFEEIAPNGLFIGVGLKL
ncbi:MAG: hypothetical protein KDD05_05885 [Psychroserpens sp.]|nr:hypothetical protein [Psychroserpens sp.]